MVAELIAFIQESWWAQQTWFKESTAYDTGTVNVKISR